ncbi:MAG TPA: DsbE family thiol:disulfide interchange protein [Aestuariivirgaceae bacterium]|jgi:cytochrome c biogenesis protein CcmG/thiol:disulfide interchange protein DsbE
MSDRAGLLNSPRLGLTLVPAVVFAALIVIFFIGLKSGDPSVVPSAIVEKPVPQFELPPLAGSGIAGLKSADLKTGKVAVVNVWASWCGPCRTEHPVLMELSKRKDIFLAGINYKDEPQNARRFLASFGQPYAAIGADDKGRASIDWGVYGVPESFVVDGNGIVRFKWVGPIADQAAREKLETAIRRAQTED